MEADDARPGPGSPGRRLTEHGVTDTGIAYELVARVLDAAPIRTQHDLDTAAADPTVTAIIVDTDAGNFTYTGSSAAAFVLHGHGQFVMNGTGENHLTAEDTVTVEVRTGTVHTHHTGSFLAYGTSIVHAHDTSVVYAYGSSTVDAFGHSIVHAYDTSTVDAFDTSTVHAHDTSDVNAYCTSIVHAVDTSTVHAHDTSGVVLMDDASADLADHASLRLLAGCRFTALGPIDVTFPDRTTEQGFTGDGPFGGFGT